MNKYLKFIIFTFVLISNAYADEFKLQCQIYAKTLVKNRVLDEGAGSAIVEISEYGKQRVIMLRSSNQSADMIAVTNVEDPDFSNIRDRSNDNKWDISHHIISSNLDISIIIDRNNGQLIASHKDNRNWTIFEVSGKCEKINQNQRKF
jgi:hypothetical protein